MARNKLIYQEEEEKQLQERNEGFHELTEIWNSSITSKKADRAQTNANQV